MFYNFSKNMKKQDIEIELTKARKAFADCGCKVYKQKIDELNKLLKDHG